MRRDDSGEMRRENGWNTDGSLMMAHERWLASRRLARSVWLELASGAAATLWLGSFLADPVRQVRFAFPAFVLIVAAVLSIVVSARQLALLSQLHGGARVAEVHRRLEQLVALRAMGATPLTPYLDPGSDRRRGGPFRFDLRAAFGRTRLVASPIVGLVLMDLVAAFNAKIAGRLGVNSPSRFRSELATQPSDGSESRANA